MKEEILLYGVCLAISIGAVAVTSLVKMFICCISKKLGHDLSGNAKEYIFTPMAIILAAVGLFFWLDKYCKIPYEEKFILIIVCFSVGTMLLYLLLFQPTRKLAVKIIQLIAKNFKVPEIVKAVKDELTEAEIFLNAPNTDLQSNADKDDVLIVPDEKPPDEELTADTEADKLREMVEIIKNKK